MIPKHSDDPTALVPSAPSRVPAHLEAMDEKDLVATTNYQKKATITRVPLRAEMYKELNHEHLNDSSSTTRSRSDSFFQCHCRVLR